MGILRILQHIRERRAESHLSHKEFVQEENLNKQEGKYISDMVFGASDGMVTTFAVVAGVTGANLSSAIILIMGFANLIADGISMAAGDYLGIVSRRDFVRKQRSRELHEMSLHPREERAEIRKIYAAKGFTGRELERAVEIVTNNRKLWADTVMKEKLNIDDDDRDPKTASLLNMTAFVIAGLVPLLSYLFAFQFPFFKEHAFALAVVLTAAAIFLVGSMRSYVTGQHWFKSGIQMLIVAGLAAVAAYAVGYFLQWLA